MPLILDGPMGTELQRRGIPTPLPGWSAHALKTAPEAVRDVHRDYAQAGATLHTTKTFRTRPAVFGSRWEQLARRAVELARDAVPADHRVAGSIAPLADCYQPAASPAQRDPVGAAREQRALARVLAEAGCDLLLCETFAHVGESWLAVEAAVETGVETRGRVDGRPGGRACSTSSRLPRPRAAPSSAGPAVS
jgi:S-methylmethionine-dependent homocysteine/selenocysteine methylase